MLMKELNFTERTDIFGAQALTQRLVPGRKPINETVAFNIIQLSDKIHIVMDEVLASTKANHSERLKNMRMLLEKMREQRLLL